MPTAGERRRMRDVSGRRVQAADLASKRKTVMDSDTTRADALLHIHQARMVPLPEPVEVPPMVNGRRLQPWEAGLYVEWAHSRRRAELALFRGLIG